MFLWLFTVIYNGQDNIGTGFHTQFAAIEANVVILCGTPVSTGIMLIVNLAALILFLQASLRALFRFAVQAYNAVRAEILVGMDKGVEARGSNFIPIER